MGAFTPSMLRAWLRDATVRVRPGEGTPVLDGGVRFLDPEQEPLSPRCLYLGEREAVTAAVLEGRLPEGCVLSAGVCDGLEAVPLPPGLWLMETRLPLLRLYNRVQEELHAFQEWDAALREAIYTNAGLQVLLERAAPRFHGTVMLANAGYRQLAAVYDPGVDDPLAQEFWEYGYHTYDTVQAVRRHEPLRGGKKYRYIEYVSTESGNYIIVRRICYQNEVHARLVVIRAGPEPDLCVSDLTELLADYIAEYMFSRQSVNYSGNAVFGGLVADLIEFRLTDPDEVIRRLKGVELSVQRYYHVMLVAFPEDQGSLENIPWNYIISQLELLFPFSDITTYRGEILLLIRKTNRGTRPRFDQPALETLLERHNGQAAIGNFSEFLTSLPPIYYQTKSVLRLGRIMDPGKRLYFFEDYSMYHLVEMADMGAQGALYSRNIVYLCHPGLITLLRYDKKTGASLTDTLYVYLRCERNAAEAAKQLFIHRNTMLNKVRRIEEVLGQSLEDPWLRERLLFSYHVLEYMRKYRREDILILHRNAVAADGKREDKREPE